MVTSSYRRTQVYLDPDEHEALRELAAQRGVSMANLVREAVGRYLGDEQPEPPARLPWEPDYEGLGIPPGPEGLVARMHARLEAGPPEGVTLPDPTLEDQEIGDFLWEEHQRHLAEWRARRQAPAAEDG